MSDGATSAAASPVLLPAPGTRLEDHEPEAAALVIMVAGFGVPPPGEVGGLTEAAAEEVEGALAEDMVEEGVGALAEAGAEAGVGALAEAGAKVGAWAVAGGAKDGEL